MKSLVFTLIFFGFLVAGCKNAPEEASVETETVDPAEQAVINQLDSVDKELDMQLQDVEAKKDDLENALNDLPK